ncbi:MAG: flagellar biosynthesis protein FlhB [bacterium]|nr:flagellar biosynthesis protein FlhB [bacterium]
MGEDGGEKTEEPTPHKLMEARKKGQIAKSKDVTSAIMILISFTAFKFSATYIWENIIKVLYRTWEYIPVDFTPTVAGAILLNALITFFISIGPMLGIVFISAIFVEVVQTGFLMSTDPIVPKLSKLNPIEGVKKFFSLKQYVELFKSLMKMAMVIFLIFGVLRKEFYMVVAAQELSLWQVMLFTGTIIMKVIYRVGVFYLIIAIFDYIYQKYEYIKSMKMSKKEIKDEYKRLEGDPIIKQRQREAQRQMAQNRQMGAVPGAEVVVTNPVHIAVAIEYKHNKMRAPIIVAKGRRLVAEEIKRVAEELYIPVVENPPLARALFKDTVVDGEISPEYYKAVAEILAFVYNLKKKRQHRF